MTSTVSGKFILSFLALCSFAVIVKLCVDSCLPYVGDEFSRVFPTNERLPSFVCEFVQESERQALMELERELARLSLMAIENVDYADSLFLSWTDISRYTILFSKVPGGFFQNFRLLLWLLLLAGMATILWEWAVKINAASKVVFWEPGEPVLAVEPDAVKKVLDAPED